MSSTLAGPLTDHCFTTVPHSGVPKGESITIAGVPTYLSAPQSSASGVKTVILYFSDVFGPFYINAQLIQDYYASQGFTVVGIDYFFGDPIHLHNEEPGWDRLAWRTKSVEQAEASLPKWVDGVKEMFGTNTKYCAVGFCFGAPWVFKVAATDMLLCAAVAHPTNLTEQDVKESKETDFAFPAPLRRRTEDILVEKKATYYFQIFSGVSHGFGTRADPEVETQKWAKEECQRTMIGWFKRFTSA
ncbi:alpha/beta-hydrolase [Rhizopogon vinicolor AM-OR11-026]|uniref:Alpha/beta-hydrolase n=1 Tax=Rhizopogon vinicolor AM-OR11-026 TaxID=1314800 RepID=A0A1B7MZ51_9AGAM|nr:alpha/beta-hydrolase [Rhizopogon vinicolor AM-OR11-026]